MQERSGDPPRVPGEPGDAAPRRFAACETVRVATPSGRALEAVVATRPAARLLGLSLLDAGAAPPLLIPRCRSVHSFWMRFAIDLAFLALPPRGASTASVVHLREALPPRRLAAAPRRTDAGRPGAITALELEAGAAARLGIEPGAELGLVPARRAGRDYRRRRMRKRMTFFGGVTRD